MGGHLGDGDAHLDAARRQRLDEPVSVRTYTGTGAESRRHLLSFSPRAVLVFAADKGRGGYTGAYTKLYAAYWADGQGSRGLFGLRHAAHRLAGGCTAGGRQCGGAE